MNAHGWDIITAVSTAATAAAAIATYFVVKRQAVIQLPTVTLGPSFSDTNNDYGEISLKIDPPDDAKFGIERVVVTHPSTARLAEKVSDPQSNKPVPGTWMTELVRDQVRQASFYFRGPRSAVVSIQVHISLRANRKVKHVIPLSPKMHD